MILVVFDIMCAMLQRRVPLVASRCASPHFTSHAPLQDESPVIHVNGDAGQVLLNTRIVVEDIYKQQGGV